MDEVSVAVTGSDEPARVDLCARCGSAFLDYFDGEPGELSRGVLEQHLEARLTEGPAVDAEGTSCPDCALHFQRQTYMEGPSVWRCGGCQAIYATLADLRALAAYRLPDEEHVRDERPSLLARLKRLFYKEPW